MLSGIRLPPIHRQAAHSALRPLWKHAVHGFAGAAQPLKFEGTHADFGPLPLRGRSRQHDLANVSPGIHQGVGISGTL
ncbi:hypothetical protein PUN4_340101 [Paraburkholderia unamae]|nr:hypothetical protein PUN4_340101 [Paraburkholderia unamae]